MLLTNSIKRELILILVFLVKMVGHGLLNKNNLFYLEKRKINNLFYLFLLVLVVFFYPNNRVIWVISYFLSIIYIYIQKGLTIGAVTSRPHRSLPTLSTASKQYPVRDTYVSVRRKGRKSMLLPVSIPKMAYVRCRHWSGTSLPT